MLRDSSEREIFEACLVCPLHERDRFIADACKNDPALEERIRRLLEAHRIADEVSLSGLVPKPDSEMRPIGPYLPVRVLGEGGMGVVYEAEQRFPVRRRVALKLVRQDMDSKQVFARFEAERQALAVMDHPNIAKVLDAGEAPDGRPYFVMELVEGIPITRYCDQNRLSVRDRLILLITLCRAVQHAHQKGVIHRDLKPSNVLVAMQDGRPVPKVIDFGIAKAIGPKLSEDLELTQSQAVIGTPAYMSPEQADRTGLDIDTRSDIYSLGVMLYELLVGVLPWDLSNDKGWEARSGPTGSSGGISMPSSRLLNLGRRGEAIAAARSSSCRDLVSELSGDLDCIVTRATAHDRIDRYDSATSLAQDIERFLNDEPVSVRPGGTLYRAGKFMKRHRPFLAAAAIALCALLLGVVGMTIGLVEADQARLEAERQAVKARSSEREANLRLRNALLAQATALRRGHSPGRRMQALTLLSQAAEIQTGGDLRDEGIASAMLTDLEEFSRWPRPVEESVSVSFEPGSGSYALGLVSGDIEIRETGSGRLLNVLSGPPGAPWVSTHSGNGRYLAVKYHRADSWEGACVRVWDLLTGRPILELPGLIQGASLAFSRDSRLLAIANEHGFLVTYELKTGRKQLQRQVTGSCTQIRFSPDDRLLAVGSREGLTLVFRRSDGAVVRQFEADTPAYCLDWSGDGKHLAVGYGASRALVWSMESGRPTAVLTGHQAEIVKLAFHPRLPLVLTYSWDETSRLWNAFSGEQLIQLQEQALGFSSDGGTVGFVGGSDLGLWRLRHGDSFQTLYGHTGKGPLCIDNSADGRLLASGAGDGIQIRTLDGSEPVRAISTGLVKDLFFVSGDRQLVSCGSDGLLLWTLPESAWGASALEPEILEPASCFYAAVDPSRTQLASFHRGERAMVRSLADRTRVLLLNAFPTAAHPSVSRRGGMVAVGNWRGDRTVVWDGHTGRVITELLAGERTVAVEFSPSGNLLATGSSGEYRFWETETWNEVLQVKRPDRFSNLPGKLAFSPDGNLVALVLDQNSIRVLESPTLKTIANLRLDDPQSVTGICFGAEGDRLFLSSAANRVHIWSFAPIAAELSRFSIGLDFTARNWAGGQGLGTAAGEVTRSSWSTDRFPSLESSSLVGRQQFIRLLGVVASRRCFGHFQFTTS